MRKGLSRFDDGSEWATKSIALNENIGKVMECVSCQSRRRAFRHLLHLVRIVALFAPFRDRGPAATSARRLAPARVGVEEV
jgi:hypothetical protein